MQPLKKVEKVSSWSKYLETLKGQEKKKIIKNTNQKKPFKAKKFYVNLPLS